MISNGTIRIQAPFHLHNVTDRWVSIAMLFRAWSGLRISTTPSTVVHSNFSNIICPVHLRKAFRTRWQNIPIGRSWSQFSISLAAELDFNAQWRTFMELFASGLAGARSINFYNRLKSRLNWKAFSLFLSSTSAETRSRGLVRARTQWFIAAHSSARHN